VGVAELVAAAGVSYSQRVIIRVGQNRIYVYIHHI
jgi:hypothetical protein